MLRRSAETLSEILGTVEARQDLFNSTVSNGASPHTAYRLEAGDGLELPLVVQPANLDLEDFFVGIATYHQSRSPVTAFTHVLDEECSKYFDQSMSNAPEGTGVTSRQLYGALGAAVGETFLAALGSGEAGGLPSYSSCKRSLSFVLSRARAVFPLCRARHVADKWVKLRQLTGLAVSDAAASTCIEVHSLLFEERNNPHGLVRELLDGLSVSDGEKALQRVFTDMYPQISSFAPELSGPFDARMKAFGNIAERIQLGSKGMSFDSLAIGYFANRIQPGSFAHAKALAKLVEFFPVALVWYGMFCGLSEEFQRSEFGFGVVAKLARDAIEPFSFERRPTCDVSLEELDILVRLPPRYDIVKPTYQKAAVIGLLPGVNVTSRYSREEEQQAEKERERDINEVAEIGDRVTMLLEDALMLMRRARSPQRRGSYSSQKRSGKAKS